MLKNGLNKFLSNSSEETEEIGKEIGQKLQPNTLLLFYGDLGAGKTTLMKGLVAEVTGLQKDEVNSPTFNYLNIYQGKTSVYHFDLYRLTSEEEFYLRGFDEYLNEGHICCIEWAEKIASYPFENALKIKIESLEKNKRVITLDHATDPF